MQEIQVQFLGREDPLEKEMATHSSILAWKSLWTEEPGGLQSMGSQELDMTWQLNDHHHHHHKILNHPFRVFLKLFKGLQRFIGAVRISFGLIVGQG